MCAGLSHQSHFCGKTSTHQPQSLVYLVHPVVEPGRSRRSFPGVCSRQRSPSGSSDCWPRSSHHWTAASIHCEWWDYRDNNYGGSINWAIQNGWFIALSWKIPWKWRIWRIWGYPCFRKPSTAATSTETSTATAWAARCSGHLNVSLAQAVQVGTDAHGTARNVGQGEGVLTQNPSVEGNHQPFSFFEPSTINHQPSTNFM